MLEFLLAIYALSNIGLLVHIALKVGQIEANVKNQKEQIKELKREIFGHA